MYKVHVDDFKEWRDKARQLLHAEIEPSHIVWNDLPQQDNLFGHTVEQEIPEVVHATPLNVPAEFLKLAEIVSLHRSSERFHLLYTMLWRLVHEEKNLLKILSDPLTNKLMLMHKSIQRDVHKTKAFVRFRQTVDEQGNAHYIAWHKPDHYSLRLSAPFFQRRFEVMKWTILTPDESVYWDGEHLHFGPGASVHEAPKGDHMEMLWKEFYRAIFNPARIKIKAMKKEMPVRHWATLPEASIIPELLAEAPERVQKMIAHQEGHALSAIDFMPAKRDLLSLRAAAQSCKGCPLHCEATQTVFGSGPEHARLVLVGEQPGDEEDKAGEVFIGPAGQILNQALEEAGIERSAIYITNAVKHFKFVRQGNLRIHRSPTLTDIAQCRPWLEAELNAIQPHLVVCLGASAARA